MSPKSMHSVPGTTVKNHTKSIKCSIISKLTIGIHFYLSTRTVKRSDIVHVMTETHAGFITNPINLISKGEVLTADLHRIIAWS